MSSTREFGKIPYTVVFKISMYTGSPENEECGITAQALGQTYLDTMRYLMQTPLTPFVVVLCE